MGLLRYWPTVEIAVEIAAFASGQMSRIAHSTQMDTTPGLPVSARQQRTYEQLDLMWGVRHRL